MTAEALLMAIRDVIQEDVGNRGLRTDPDSNLLTACAGDFIAACRSLAETPEPAVGIVTGFYIADAETPSAETDGPLGAVFLARALAPLGVKLVLISDEFCVPALQAGLACSGLRKQVPVVTLPSHADSMEMVPQQYREMIWQRTGQLTHLIALERAGPSHTPESLRAQPGNSEESLADFVRTMPDHLHDRCFSMRGLDITSHLSPVHWLFEDDRENGQSLITIGIGDGGNEIGMGKVPWSNIQRNIPRGGQVACRVPVNHLVVAGVSNWGAYGLAAGVRILRDQAPDAELLDLEQERAILDMMVTKGPLVDGISGKETPTVDGLEFHRHAEPLRRIADLLGLECNDAQPTTVGLQSTQPVTNGIKEPPQAPDNLPQTGLEVRLQARSGEWSGPTSGLAPGYVQANLVVVPRELAFDFMLFCQRNPKPCPLLEVTDPGHPEPATVAPGADLRTDIPRYCVYRDGQLVEEPYDLKTWWREELVAFLLGCSFTFENALQQAGVPIRHLDQGCNVPMYRTNLACRSAGALHGPIVVSMRPMTPAQAIQATEICSRFPKAHGAPIHFGDPGAIGIRDLDRPDFGSAVEICPGEIPVFWACGVTPQAVAMQACPPLLITHKPGHMFVTDWRDNAVVST